MKFIVLTEEQFMACGNSGYFLLFQKKIAELGTRLEAYEFVEDLREELGLSRRYSCYQSFIVGYRKWLKNNKRLPTD